MIENVTPILRAHDLAATKAYFQGVLGFTLDWDIPGMCSVSRDEQAIMISDRQGAAGSWLWIGVEDADALYAEFLGKGAFIRDPPRNFPWAYEFQVEDPNGHVLRFGAESKPGQPFGQFRL